MLKFLKVNFQLLEKLICRRNVRSRDAGERFINAKTLNFESSSTPSLLLSHYLFLFLSFSFFPFGFGSLLFWFTRLFFFQIFFIPLPSSLFFSYLLSERSPSKAIYIFICGSLIVLCLCLYIPRPDSNLNT